MAAKLGLKPWEFLKMSPGQFRCYAMFSRYRDAWIVKHMGIAEMPSEEELLGIPVSDPFEGMTDEERELAVNQQFGSLVKQEE